MPRQVNIIPLCVSTYIVAPMVVVTAHSLTQVAGTDGDAALCRHGLAAL